MSRSVLAALGAIGMLAAPARAQTPPTHGPTIAEQRVRVATLGRLSRAARAVADSIDRALDAAVRYDTLRVGPLVLLAWPEDQPLLRAGAALAWQRVGQALRGDSALLDREWLYLRLGNASAARRLVSRHPTRSATVPGQSPDAAAVGDQLVTMIGQSLADAGGGDLRAWLGGSVPLEDQGAWLTQVYRELVTAPSQAAHRCYSGDVAACRTALALDSIADPATAWYTQGEREAIVRRFGSTNDWMLTRDPARRGIISRCLDAHDDWSCVAFLHTLSRANLHPPLGLAARAAVAHVALSAAPPGAYSRFLAPRATPGARLVAAAGLPLDSIVGMWRARVLAARPPSPHVAATTQVATLLWVVILGALSLRSTRWRSA